MDRDSQKTWHVTKVLFFRGNHATFLCLSVSLAIKWYVEPTSSTVILYPDTTTRLLFLRTETLAVTLISVQILLFKKKKNLMLDCNISFLGTEISFAIKCRSCSCKASFSGTGNKLENFNNPKSSRTLRKAWMISFLSFLHDFLLWVMLLKAHWSLFGKNVKMINNMILLENDQIISKVAGTLNATIFIQKYFKNPVWCSWCE